MRRRHLDEEQLSRLEHVLRKERRFVTAMDGGLYDLSTKIRAISMMRYLLEHIPAEQKQQFQIYSRLVSSYYKDDVLRTEMDYHRVMQNAKAKKPVFGFSKYTIPLLSSTHGEYAAAIDRTLEANLDEVLQGPKKAAKRNFLGLLYFKPGRTLLCN